MSLPRPSLEMLLSVGLFVLLAVLYPPYVRAAMEHGPVWAFALGHCSVMAFVLFLGRRWKTPFWGGRSSAVFSLTVFLFGVIAAVSGEGRFLLLVPPSLHLALSFMFLLSLRGPLSLIERGALFIQPRAPDFIRPYCRKMTACWFGVLFVHGAIGMGLAIFASPETWSRYASWIGYLMIGAFMIGEALFRKVWFRHYETSLLDRVLSPLFPAEQTERGRRSLAYLRRMKEEDEQVVS